MHDDFLIGTSTLALWANPPLLITTARNLHDSTKLRCTIRSTLVGNPGVFHFDPLTKYAVAFFRISTSIFKLAFSRRRRFNSLCKAATLPAGGQALGCPSLNSFFARHALDQCVSVPRGMPGRFAASVSPTSSPNLIASGLKSSV